MYLFQEEAKKVTEEKRYVRSKGSKVFGQYIAAGYGNLLFPLLLGLAILAQVGGSDIKFYL